VYHLDVNSIVVYWHAAQSIPIASLEHLHWITEFRLKAISLEHNGKGVDSEGLLGVANLIQAIPSFPLSCPLHPSLQRG